MTIINNIKRLKQTRKDLRNNCTETEEKMWEYLKGSQLIGLKFRRQHSIGRYILDFYCPKIKLCIELDGDIHLEREEYDNIRTEFLNGAGIKVLRYKNQEIMGNIDNVLNDIKQNIK